MLPRSKRINRKLFDQKIQKTKQFSFNFYSVRVHSLKNGQKSRFSVVVSKKVEKRAVLRNHLKRIIYSAVLKCEKNIPNGYYFIYPKKEILNKKYKTVETALFEDFKHINI